MEETMRPVIRKVKPAVKVENAPESKTEGSQEVSSEAFKAMQEQLEAAAAQIVELSTEVAELKEQANKPSPEDQRESVETGGNAHALVAELNKKIEEDQNQIRRDVFKVLQLLQAGNLEEKDLAAIIGPRLI